MTAPKAILLVAFCFVLTLPGIVAALAHMELSPQAMALVAGGEYQAALQAADEILEDFAEEFRRHGEPIEPYRVRISAHLELGDGRQALAALDRPAGVDGKAPVLRPGRSCGRKQE